MEPDGESVKKKICTKVESFYIGFIVDADSWLF